MNPVVTRLLTSVAMRLLTTLGGILIAKGWLTSDEVAMAQGPAVEGIVGLLLVLGTGLYGILRGWWDRQKIVTALASPPMSEKQLEARIGSGGAASVLTPKTELPRT